VKLEPPKLYFRRKHSRKAVEILVKIQRRCDRINQRRPIGNLTLAKKPMAAQFSAPALGFDPPPIVCRLKHGFAVRRRFQFDYYETAIAPERQQIYLTGRRSKLMIYWRKNQIRIDQPDISPQD
jgi:hypothetical protein